MAERVAGVDGCKLGWVAVVLAGGRFLEARLIPGVDATFEQLADVGRIAIDVPIGYGPRQADALARERVGGSSVFSIPERERFDAPFGEGGGISAQAHALGDRIRHITALAAGDPRFREAHPELCFTAMNGMKRLKNRKKSAGGAFERLELLRKHGINIDRGHAGCGGDGAARRPSRCCGVCVDRCTRGGRFAARSARGPRRARGRDLVLSNAWPSSFRPSSPAPLRMGACIRLGGPGEAAGRRLGERAYGWLSRGFQRGVVAVASYAIPWG